jgi:hypothetical protein
VAATARESSVSPGHLFHLMFATFLSSNFPETFLAYFPHLYSFLSDSHTISSTNLSHSANCFLSLRKHISGAEAAT